MKTTFEEWSKVAWNKRGFLFDADETLMHKGKATDRLRNALQLLVATGARAGICTGRPLPEARAVCFPLFHPDEYHVVAGGAQVVRGNGDIFWESRVQNVLAEDICRQVIRLGGDVALTTKDGTVHLGPRLTQANMRLNSNIRYGVISQETLSQISDFSSPVLHVWWPTPEVDAYLQGISDSVEIKKIARSQGGHSYDITNFGITKAQGAGKWMEVVGVSLTDTAAFGDAENDMELLRAVGLPIAVANAHPALQAIAVKIIGSVMDDGVPEFLESLW